MKSPIKALAISSIFLFCLASCSFSAPSIKEEKGVLTEAGYTVTVTSGDDIDTTSKDTPLYGLVGVEDCLYAQKDSDEIYLIYFVSTSFASDSMIYTKLKVGQINQLVYTGTAQAIKDAKL